MHEDFVPFSLANKLEEKGFKIENTDWCYLDGNLVQVKKYVNISPYEYAPTISQVLKWLREEKKFHIAITLFKNGWTCAIIDFSSKGCRFIHDICRFKNELASYELAALAGIEYVIDNLI